MNVVTKPVVIEGALSAATSAWSVVAALSAFTETGKLVPEGVDANIASLLDELGTNAGDLIVAESVDFPARRAFEVLIKPSDRYIDLVAAIALGLDVAFDLDAHGWPILMSPDRTEEDHDA